MIPQPDIRPTTGRWYALQDDFALTWLEDGAFFSLTVPKGFRSDGASVPRLLWSVIGLTPDGPIRAGALLHDFIYRYGGEMPAGSFRVYVRGEWAASAQPITRRRADWILRHFAQAAGISPRRALLVWTGVRVGGWWSWKGTQTAGGAFELDS